MKLWGLAIAAVGVLAAGFQTPANSKEFSIFLSGNAQGYLSPCGCSAPMIGGSKRRATAIEKLGIPNRTLLLENGGLVKGVSRQDEIKLETFSQMHAASHGALLNLTPNEASLGPGAVLSMSRLSNQRLLTASVKSGTGLDLRAYREEGPFLVGGVTSRGESLGSLLSLEPVRLEAAVRGLVASAQAERKPLLLVLDGSREEAVELARQFPSIALIQFQSIGTPPTKPERVGNVLLASPGDSGKHLVRLVWRGDRFVSYAPMALDPGFKDDPQAKSIFKTYLNRVSGENLIDEFPRSESPKFAGTPACSSCHAAAAKVWKGSKHAHGLKTLEVIGHDRDPDCVECHVVGLASIYGFRTRKQDPGLAHVGCESCHGPGAAHAAAPTGTIMGRSGSSSCLPCHTVENSPRFDFAHYWAKIKH